MKPKHIVLTLIVFFLIAGLFSLRKYNEWHYKKYQFNTDQNHNVMKYFVDDSFAFVRTAFYRLESEFKNANDFNLQTYSVRTRDTVVKGILDTINLVYFTYFLDNDSSRRRLAKLSVFRNQPYLDLFNVDPNNNDEYSKIQSEVAEHWKQTNKDLKDFIDSSQSIK